MPLREITLVLHFLGLGLFVATLIPGFIIESKYRKTTDLQAKAALLSVLRPIGLLGPLGALLMLITGIGNMYAIGVGLFDFGWLTAKIIFFAIAATNGAVNGARGRKRGMLVQSMMKGESPTDAEAKLKEYDKQLYLFYFVNGIFLLAIVSLSVYGRLGGQ